MRREDVCTSVLYVLENAGRAFLCLPGSNENPLSILKYIDESWTPYIDGLLPHMMFDENSYFFIAMEAGNIQQLAE